MTMGSEPKMTALLALTPLEASDVLFELAMTDEAARARAVAIARERTRRRDLPQPRRLTEPERAA